MNRLRVPFINLFERVVRAFVCALSIFGWMPSAGAQIHCASWVDTLLDTTNNCVSEPSRPRASDVETFRWKGHDYVIVNRGNELSIFNVDDPTNPQLTATSNFKFGTRGDSDYDLIDFDVCDDCRYAVLSHKVKRTVVFNLGGGATPAFPSGAWAFYDGSDTKIGGYTFSKGNQQYLITAGLPGGCVSGSTLYTLNGVANLGFVECVEVAGSEILLKGLHERATGDALYLFTGAQTGNARVFRADGTGNSLSLVHVASPVGMWGRRYELSIDPNSNLLASANFTANEIQIWDITDPESPLRLWTIPGQASNVSLRSPSANTSSTMMVNTNGWPNSTRTFTVGTSGPVEFESDFWTDPSLIHNDLPVCAFASGGALSIDGSVLFLSRYAIHQVFDLAACLDPFPATASLTVAPPSPFPGDTVEIRATSVGQVQRWAMWVTEEPSGAVVAGTTEPSNANPHAFDFLIPSNLAWDTSFVAHIVIESDDLPPADPTFDAEIEIDRTPQASMSVNPAQVVVGENVTLTATAEGTPATNPYHWIIDPPTGSSFPRTGVATIVAVDKNGPWDFHLTVDYDHGAEGGGWYEAAASVLGFTPTSVVADFSVSPAGPVHTQPVILDGSASRPVGGDLSFAWHVESPLHNYTGCPAQMVCTIPGNSLNPDTTYDVTLSVTNNDGGAVSEITKPVHVTDGNFQPVIVVSPSDPQIGEQILFTIDGVPVGITKANWSFGAPGCGGVDPTPQCTPGLWTDCKAEVYKYAFAGTWPVHLSVEVDGNTISAAPRLVTVSEVGSCSSGGLECGNTTYDSQHAASAARFGGGLAGDPDHMFAVKFELSDFGYLPGRFKLSSFCAANSIDYSAQGGPWPNQVFVYGDAGGAPDDSVILGQGTIWTGNGAGPSQVVVESPITIRGDFWLVSRGDPRWDGEDLNLEYDSTANVGRSYTSSTGISGLHLASNGNFMLRVQLEPQVTVFVDGFESGGLTGWSSAKGN
jgi:hypothetical protein